MGEGFIGEESAKNNITEQEIEVDADTECLSDWQSAWDGYFEDRRKEAEEAQNKNIEDPEEHEEIEEKNTQDIKEDDIINKPNFIWNESKETRWGKC